MQPNNMNLINHSKPIPYKPGTKLTDILIDAWSRDFEYAQVVEEAAMMGFTITTNTVSKAYKLIDINYEEYLQKGFGVPLNTILDDLISNPLKE